MVYGTLVYFLSFPRNKINDMPFLRIIEFE